MSLANLHAAFSRGLILATKFRLIRWSLTPLIISLIILILMPLALMFCFQNQAKAETTPSVYTWGYYSPNWIDPRGVSYNSTSCDATAALFCANYYLVSWPGGQAVGLITNRTSWSCSVSCSDGRGWYSGGGDMWKWEVCPAVAAGETPFTLDPGGQTCSRPDPCPIDPLPDLPTDDCSKSLEAGRGKDVNNACSSKLLPEMQRQAQCLADKIHALGLSTPYTGPSATVRTAAYQKHLLEVWEKLEEIKKKVRTDEQKQACATVIANANNEMEWHKIKSEPSNKGNEAPHVEGKAIDIPMDVVDALKARVSNTTFVTFTGCIFCMPIAITTIGDVQDYVNSAVVNPTACNLKWGGRFKRIDEVHFQLP